MTNYYQSIFQIPGGTLALLIMAVTSILPADIIRNRTSNKMKTVIQIIMLL